MDLHHRKNHYIIPQNKLGQDIYIRTSEFRRVSNVIKMPSGGDKPVKVPVSKNLLDAHLKGKHEREFRSMVTIIIGDSEVSSHLLQTRVLHIMGGIFNIPPWFLTQVDPAFLSLFPSHFMLMSLGCFPKS